MDSIEFTDTPYSNREIREKWKDMSAMLIEIRNEVKKTNGSVADLNKWRERMNGGAIVAGLFMSFIVMPILAWSLYVLVHINDTVHQAVDQALSAYDITTKR